MSLLHCERCAGLIDTDDDPECFVEIGHEEEICLCERCRQRHEDELERTP